MLDRNPAENQKETQKNSTVYNFDTIDVDGKPEVRFKCLEKLVGERGFEPPTPWSRIRDSGVVLNVFNLLQWCFNRLIPIQSRHSGMNVSPRMAVPTQDYSSTPSKSAPTVNWLMFNRDNSRTAHRCHHSPAHSCPKLLLVGSRFLRVRRWVL
jgi:hypothetical protein